MGDGGWVPPGQRGSVDDDGGARGAAPARATAVDSVPVDAAAPLPGAAPVPADRPTGQRRRRLVVAGVLAVAAVGTAAMVAALIADRGAADDRAAERRSEHTPTSSASTAPPPSPSASVEPAGPPATVTVSPPGGGFTVDLPELWLAGFPGTDVRGLRRRARADRRDVRRDGDRLGVDPDLLERGSGRGAAGGRCRRRELRPRLTRRVNRPAGRGRRPPTARSTGAAIRRRPARRRRGTCGRTPRTSASG